MTNEQKRQHIVRDLDYQLTKFDKFNYDILKYIPVIKKAGRGVNDTVNDCIIMADTETSKQTDDGSIKENYVVAWTISIRTCDINLCTLYGNRPTEMMTCIQKIKESMEGHILFIYFHNMAYDYVFLRKFLYDTFSYPSRQLNTKPHYPICIEWDNGLLLKDSLILAQRGLDSWAKELNVLHQKATGKWDYDLIRNQQHEFTADELEYIEHDTLAGCECIDALRKKLHKHIYSMPYTATGIPREEVRKRGHKNRARETFLRRVPTFEQQMKLERIFHGGYTHGNRHQIGWTITEEVIPFDFASSYPHVLLTENYVCESFGPERDCTLDEIVSHMETHAFMFKLSAIGVTLKDKNHPFPAMQLSKCVHVINPICDNGRLLEADAVEIYLNDVTASIIYEQYEFKLHKCLEVESAMKGPLPKWFKSYVWECFEAKTRLKGGNPVDYALAKSKLNSLYGMCVQKPVKDLIHEDYESGEFTIEYVPHEEEYQKYVDSRNSVLSYSIGVWCTSYAMKNLYKMIDCCKEPLYCDTDSCYGIGWDMDKVKAYNDDCIRKLKESGFDGIQHNGRTYYTGIMEEEDSYTEFRYLGAKRYCGRKKKDGKLKITIAGVPKKGVECLDDNIEKFKKDFIFPGSKTGKKLHTYFFMDSIHYINGNEAGDSIDLSPCDYKLDMIDVITWDDILRMKGETEIETYNIEELLL